VKAFALALFSFFPEAFERMIMQGMIILTFGFLRLRLAGDFCHGQSAAQKEVSSTLKIGEHSQNVMSMK